MHSDDWQARKEKLEYEATFYDSGFFYIRGLNTVIFKDEKVDEDKFAEAYMTYCDSNGIVTPDTFYYKVWKSLDGH